MLRLLNIEFQKLRHNRSARILITLYFGILVFASVMSSIEFTLFGNDILVADFGVFNFPYIWHYNTYIAAIAKLFLAVVIVSMVANEYSNKTLKQNLIDGLSKREFVLSKFYMILVFAGVSTLLVFVSTLILGYSWSTYTATDIVFQDLEFVGAYFLKLVTFFSFCLFVAMLIKRSAFSLGFILLWQIIELIVLGLVSYSSGDKELAVQIHDFFPLEAMSSLIVNPGPRLSAIKETIELASQNSFEYDYAVPMQSVILCIVYTALFIVGTHWLLRRRDL